MNTLNFLDANVWLALLWSRHAHSEKAREWFDASADQQFLFSRFTQITVLRLLTTEKVMGTDVRGMIAAWTLWDQLLSDDRISFLPEPERVEYEFRAQSLLTSPSPKVWADAYLVAFSTLTGTRLVSFDRALAGRRSDVLIL